MMEYLNFMFQSLGHFIGVLILISVILNGIANIFKSLRNKNKKLKPFYFWLRHLHTHDLYNNYGWKK